MPKTKDGREYQIAGVFWERPDSEKRHVAEATIVFKPNGLDRITFSRTYKNKKTDKWKSYAFAEVEGSDLTVRAKGVRLMPGDDGYWIACEEVSIPYDIRDAVVAELMAMERAPGNLKAEHAGETA